MAAAAVVCGALSLAAREATAAPSQLMVTSRPSGATVFFDGKESGRTPVVFLDLKPGPHEVKIVLEGYRTSVKRVRLKPGPDTLEVALEAEAAGEPAPDEGGKEGAAGPRDGAARREALEPGKDAGSPTAESEAAVDRAVEWLVRVQEADGRWDGERRFAPGDPGQDADPGVTGLALLALMGAGHSETAGAHSDAVKRGVTWLVSKQAPGGEIGGGYEVGRGYNHAIASMALVAACGRRGGSTFRAAQKAIDCSIAGVGFDGWRYRPGMPGDMSVTVWHVMQFRTARDAGLRVDGRAFQSAMGLLDRCTKPDGTISYQPERSGTPTMTAAGLICYQTLGFKRTDGQLTRAAEHLFRNLPDRRKAVDFYYWHLGTTALYQMGGKGWEDWNSALHRALVPNKTAGDGGLAGSWDPVGTWCGSGGRVYATAMAALCLEAPYRYPLIK